MVEHSSQLTSDPVWDQLLAISAFQSNDANSHVDFVSGLNCANVFFLSLLVFMLHFLLLDFLLFAFWKHDFYFWICPATSDKADGTKNKDLSLNLGPKPQRVDNKGVVRLDRWPVRCTAEVIRAMVFVSSLFLRKHDPTATRWLWQ